ncbi:MAG: hypothetical protein V4447_10605 [Pseudomonadota bacterium]
MKLIAVNNAGTKLSASISPTQTTIAVTAGTGALFGTIPAGSYLVLTLADAATGLIKEIIWATALSGDTFTVLRAQEGTTGKAFAIFDTVSNLFTAGQLAALAQTSLLGTASTLNASDQLGGVSAIQPYAGNPNGNVAGNAATGPLPPSMVWDTTDSLLWVCVGTGNTASAVWRAYGYEQGTVYCGTSTGSANAQVLTPIPPITGYGAGGLSVAFIAGFTNTGAMSINISTKGAVPVYKDSPAGPVPLTGGEVVAGNMISMRYDGTRFQLTATELGTAALKNTGNTVADPGTGALEISSPFGSAITGNSYSFLAADRGFSRKRTNSGAGMTDTLPDVTTLLDGWWTTIVNTDSVAVDIISAPAGVSVNGTVGATVSLQPGQNIRIGYDGSGYWVTQSPVSKLAASQFAYLNISNAGQTVPPGQYYVDSSGGPFSLSLEIGPVIGDNYSFKDFAQTWSANPVTLNGNGSTIQNAATWNLDTSGWQIDIIYSSGNWSQQ